MLHSEEQFDTAWNGKQPKNYSAPFSPTFANQCAVNFDKLKPSALMLFDKVLEKVQVFQKRNKCVFFKYQQLILNCTMKGIEKLLQIPSQCQRR